MDAELEPSTINLLATIIGTDNYKFFNNTF